MCGNGKVESGESCDDGNTTADDGCDANCKVDDGWDCSGEPSSCTPKCGNGKVLGMEGRDDNNMNSGDGCSSICAIEVGYDCNNNQPTTCTRLLQNARPKRATRAG